MKNNAAQYGNSKAKAILNFLFIGLACQEILWIHTYQALYVSGNVPSNALRALAMGIGILPSLMIYIPNRKYLARLPGQFSTIFSLWLFTLVASLIVGALNFIALKHFAGDLIRFLTPWLAFWLALIAMETILRDQNKVEIQLNKIIRYTVYIGIISALITIYFGIKAFGYHLSASFFLLLIPLSILQETVSFRTRTLAFLCSFGALLICSKRTTLMLASFMLIAAITVRARQKLTAILSIGVLLIVGFTSIIFAQSLILPDVDITEHISEMIDSISEIVLEDRHDSSYAFRYAEVLNIEDFYSNNPIMLPFGIGFGSDIPMIYDTGASNERSPMGMHHAHKGFYLYLLRHGILGLLLLGYFGILVFKVLIKGIYLATPIAIWCGLYCLSRFVNAYAGNVMMEELDLPIYLAMGWIALKSSPSFIRTNTQIT